MEAPGCLGGADEDGYDALGEKARRGLAWWWKIAEGVVTKTLEVDLKKELRAGRNEWESIS